MRNSRVQLFTRRGFSGIASVSILLANILALPVQAQNNSPEHWQAVDRFVGTIRYEVVSGPQMPVEGLPGSGLQTIEYRVVLERIDERTWRGPAEGSASVEVQAESRTGKSTRTIHLSGQGSVSGEAFLTINFRRGHYSLGITGVKSVPARYRELWTGQGLTLRDVDEQVQSNLVRVSTQNVPSADSPLLPQSGLTLSGQLEGAWQWQAHTIRWSLRPDGFPPSAQREEDFSCGSPGSLIYCQAQALGHSEPIAGTPFRLHYRSDRVMEGCTHCPGAAGTAYLGAWTLSIHHFFDPDERILYLGDGRRRSIPEVEGFHPPFPGVLVAAEDAAEIYHFDDNGRHLRTLQALTGAALHTFHYSRGLLVMVEDVDGNRLTIERGAGGVPRAIQAPYGQITGLEVDASGFLRSILKPGGEPVRFAYDEKGLLVSKRDARGNASSYAYDGHGRLIEAGDPAGGFRTFERAELPNGYRITETTALDRHTQYIVENQGGGSGKWVNTFPGGFQHSMEHVDRDTSALRFQDGTEVRLSKKPDPRFGLQAPVITMILVSPDGTESVIEVERDAQLEDPSNPLSLRTLTETVTIDGKIYTDVFDASNRTYTRTAPSGRRTVITVDEAGRVLQYRPYGQAPAVFRYDRGRLSEFSRGSGAGARTVRLGYNPRGHLETITGPLLQTTRLEYDPAGLPAAMVSPGMARTRFEHDPAGNVTGITPPGRPKHSFTYTPVHLLESYRAPAAGMNDPVTRYSYNPERERTKVELPGRGSVSFEYDGTGRLSRVMMARGAVRTTYDDHGRPEAVFSPHGSLSYTYSGNLLSGKTWQGEVAGSVEFGRRNDLLLSSITVNGRSRVRFDYDDDGLLIRAGDLILERGADTGLVERSRVGVIRDRRSTNEFGERTGYSAAFDGKSLFEAAYERDALGRITAVLETTDRGTRQDRFSYDADGRLTEIRRDGERIAAFEYDGNGNRLRWESAAGSIGAVYDEQDRLVSSGGATYSYGPDGQLASRTEGGKTTTYRYDELGNLMEVGLPGGRKIEYLIDGDNRRIGKKVDGARVKGFLYMDALHPVAELDGGNEVRSVFVYGAGQNVPDYMERDGTVFRFITDHVGSVRLVIDARSGHIVQRLDYDPFGRVVEDTHPGFQPFGFAGGLYDEHTGLVRFGARDYDPAAGRWTARDPILFAGGDTNLYAYAANDPVNRIDPSGFYSIAYESGREHWENDRREMICISPTYTEGDWPIKPSMGDRIRVTVGRSWKKATETMGVIEENVARHIPEPLRRWFRERGFSDSGPGRTVGVGVRG